MRRLFTILAACLTIGLIAQQAVADQIYWTDNDQSLIYRSDLSGANRQVVLNLGAGADPRGIAIDSNAGLMYWAENGANRIRRANLDGTGVTTIISTGLSFPADVELDLAAGKIYWADRDADRIARANLNGTSVETVLSLPGPDATAPYFLKLDPVGGKLYWSDNDSGQIRRANLAVGSTTEVVVSGLDRVRDIALDTAAGKIYWNDRDTSLVQRQDLAGGGRQTLYGPAGLLQPHGLLLHQGTLYFADGDAHLIGSGPASGGVAITTVTSLPAPFHPWDIDVAVTPVPEPGSLALASIALACAGGCWMRRSIHARQVG